MSRTVRHPRDAGRAPVELPLLDMADVEVLEADITRLEVDAIANAANTDLRNGGGVARAIVRA